MNKAELNNISNIKPDSNQKYAVLFEFNGKNFAGSQIQMDIRTVQKELEDALKTALRTKIRLHISGRTDTGVHAQSQVAHFTADKAFSISKLIYSLNGLISKDVAVRDIQQVNEKFDARRSATKRWYRYSIYNHPYRSALETRSLHVNVPLDEKLMDEALKVIEGHHDFASFKNANSYTPYSDCIVYKASCVRDKDYVHIDLVANRFVYNMVRIITGTLLEIGTKKQPVSYLSKALSAKDRTKAGITAKPDGLTLMAVEYPEEFKLFETDNYPKVINVIGSLMEAPNEDIFRKAS